jgi:pyrimidine-nucleoside phosphorylase
VLDVKYGSGAFLPEPERGAELARTMIALAGRFGLRACAFQTSMAQPLGRAAGHAIEIRESLECLRGGGPEDLTRLVRVLGGEMLRLGGLAADAAEGERRIEAALRDGSALECFARVVEAQGGDPRVVERPELLPRAPDVELFTVDRDGALRFEDVAAAGLAVLELGGGRRALGDAIDPGVGLVWRAKHGDALRAGEPVCELHHRDGRGLERARELLARAVSVGEPAEAPPLVLARLEA